MAPGCFIKDFKAAPPGPGPNKGWGLLFDRTFMASQFSLVVTQSSGLLRTFDSTMRRECLREVGDVLDKLVGPGSVATGNSIVAQDGGVQATGTATFSGTGTATDTVTVGVQAFTAVASGATANQWNVGASAAASATNLAAAVNASTAMAGVVTASVAGAVVTFTSVYPGKVGNQIVLAKSSTAVAVSGGHLASGAGNAPVTYSF